MGEENVFVANLSALANPSNSTVKSLEGFVSALSIYPRSRSIMPGKVEKKSKAIAGPFAAGLV